MIQRLKKYGRENAVSFMGPDIVKYAESFGAHGLAINTADDIEPVMRKAMSLNGPVLATSMLIIAITVAYLINFSHANKINRSFT